MTDTQPTAHTLTIESVFNGSPHFALHCHHDPASWGHYDQETGEYSEADGCWLMSWWDGVGDELVNLPAPIECLPIPVRPSDDWTDNGGSIVLDES